LKKLERMYDDDESDTLASPEDAIEGPLTLERAKSLAKEGKLNAPAWLVKAASLGDAKLFRWLVARLKKEKELVDHLWDYSLKGAAANGHLDIVKVCVKHVESTTNAFIEGCKSGSKSVVKFLAERPENKDSLGVPEYGFARACENGHLQIVTFCLTKFSRIQNTKADFEDGFRLACLNGHADVAKLLISKGACDWNKAFRSACKGGHFELAVTLAERGATDFRKGLFWALECANNKLAKFCVQKLTARADSTAELVTRDAFDEALLWSVENANWELTKYTMLCGKHFVSGLYKALSLCEDGRLPEIKDAFVLTPDSRGTRKHALGRISFLLVDMAAFLGIEPLPHIDTPNDKRLSEELKTGMIRIHIFVEQCTRVVGIFPDYVWVVVGVFAIGRTKKSENWPFPD